MTFPADDIFLGPRSWGRLFGYEGIIWHTTEYGGTDRDTALRCARDQARRTADGGWAQPGSYNIIIYDKNSTGGKGGALLTVPYLEASGGINPASKYWAPKPFLKSSLPSRAYLNPTMYHLQVAFSGNRANFDAGKIPPNMVETAIAIKAWWEREIAKKKTVQSGHRDWQTNRSDPGSFLFDRITGVVLPNTAVSTSEELPVWVNTIRPVNPPYWAVLGPDTNIRLSPSLAADQIAWNTKDDAESRILVVAHATGDEDAGSTDWLVYALDVGGLRCVHSKQVIGTKPLVDTGSATRITAMHTKASKLAAVLDSAKALAVDISND